MALKGDNPVVGGTVLRRAAIESPDYVPGVSGWIIKQDGSAEFNNLTIRGSFQGTNFVINSAGTFFYSPSEAAGNLVASSAAVAGIDPFGNNYLAGQASYGAAAATAVAAGFVALYTGTLAGGWTQQATIETDVSDDLVLSCVGTLQLAGNTIVGGNLTVNGTFINSGSTGTGSNGGVTSGPSGTVNAFPAAGPNHTHAEIHTHPL